MENTDDISCRALGTIPTKRGGRAVDFHFETVSGAGRRSGLMLSDYELSRQSLSPDSSVAGGISITWTIEVPGIRGSNESILTLNNIVTIVGRLANTKIDSPDSV